MLFVFKAKSKKKFFCFLEYAKDMDIISIKVEEFNIQTTH